MPADCVGTLIIGLDTLNVAIANCAPAPAGEGVLQTGQTQCDDGGFVWGACPGNPAGQDGELQKGTARSYTDNGQTITDNATGLEWEKLCFGAVNPGCPVINDVNTEFTWAQAFQKIADLNAANFAGHNDWRLPNVNELQTLVNYDNYDSAVDSAFMNGTNSFTRSQAYWTSTTYLATSFLAWVVHFGSGAVRQGEKTEGGFHFVRAVRGGS